MKVLTTIKPYEPESLLEMIISQNLMTYRDKKVVGIEILIDGSVEYGNWEPYMLADVIDYYKSGHYIRLVEYEKGDPKFDSAENYNHLFNAKWTNPLKLVEILRFSNSCVSKVYGLFDKSEEEIIKMMKDYNNYRGGKYPTIRITYINTLNESVLEGYKPADRTKTIDLTKH